MVTPRGEDSEFVAAVVRRHGSAMVTCAARLVGPGLAQAVVTEALARSWHERGSLPDGEEAARSWLLVLVIDVALMQAPAASVATPSHDALRALRTVLVADGPPSGSPSGNPSGHSSVNPPVHLRD